MEDIGLAIAAWCDLPTLITMLQAGIVIPPSILYTRKFCQLWRDEEKRPGLPVCDANMTLFLKVPVTSQRLFNDYIRYSGNVHAPFVKYMLTSKLDIDVSAYHDHALHAAAWRGLPDVINVLLDAGADIRSGKDAALVAAVHNGHTDTVRLLVNRGANVDEALSLSTCVGNMAVVRILLDAGADVHKNDENALRCAASSGRAEIMDTIIEAGADVRLADRQHALVWQAYCHPHAIKRLIEAGADIHMHDEQALRWAVNGGLVESVKVLLDHGADANAAGDTPLMMAVRGNRWEVAKVLLQHGARRDVLGFVDRVRLAML